MSKSLNRWVKFFRRGVYRRVFVWLGLGIFLTIGMPPVLSQVRVANLTLLAQANAQQLVQESQEKYENGEFSQAVELLQRAAKLFEAPGQSRNRAITLVNLGHMQSELGQHYQACETLTQALGLSSEVCKDGDLPKNPLQWVSESLRQTALVQANSLRIFGDILRALGKLKESQQILDQSMELVKKLPSSEQAKVRKVVLLSLGNTLRARGNLERDRQAPPRYDYLPWRYVDRSSSITEQALDYYQSAVEKYDEAYEIARQTTDDLSAPIRQIQAQVNRLSLLIEIGKGSAPNTLFIKQGKSFSIEDKQISTICDELSKLPNNREKIYAQINLAKNLAYLQQKFSNDKASWKGSIDRLLEEARKGAEQLGNKRAESYALGNLGGLYESIGRREEAMQKTQEALYLSQPSEAPDIAYQWQWQLGRLLETEGNREKAISSYQAAVKTLESARNDLLAINSDVQFSFRDNVEPLYRELVDLLLKTESSSQLSSDNLKEAIRKIDNLQLAELQNFLRCNLSDLVQVERIKAPNTAIIYPIILKDRLAIIYELPGQEQPLEYPGVQVSHSEVEKTLRKLRDNLTVGSKTPEVIKESKKVYKWLIKPLEQVLEQSKVETIVFVLDGYLRNIPMAVLYDEEHGQYLIDKGYTIALAPRLKLFSPKTSPQRLKVFTGGVGIPHPLDDSTFFPEIKKLREELEGIAKVVTTSQPLLDTDFTTSNIQQWLKSGSFSAIHWKTHGVFSSDPDKTFIFAYNERIKAKELNNLIQIGSKRGATPLELLVLSACETAQGDNRAVLGLAGIAARTGTRSVLSTLWTAQDIANTQFMIRFYQELSKPNTTKAQAVRQAQIALRNEFGYTAPHFWANYILIGNWL